jgi:hypothetical protein
LLELDRQLSAFLKGEAQPAGARACLDLAEFCRQHKRLYAASTRLYAAAFTADPRLADDLPRVRRYSAACTAALAAAGQGEDAAKLDAKERSRLRGQALAWLRADLGICSQGVEKGPPKARPVVAKLLRYWQAGTSLATVRDPAALAKLPEEERAAWTRLWADVQALLERADGKGTKGK